MKQGNFYFLNDRYFADFKDSYLMRNKETVEGKAHNRPCFYAIEDKAGIFWMIPISSRVDKFKIEKEKKIAKYGRCDTIVFGKVLGEEKAFLIQNMCPVTSKYINNEYVDVRANIPVKIQRSLERDIVKKTQKVLQMHRKGKKIVFPDIMQIEHILKQDLESVKEKD